VEDEGRTLERVQELTDALQALEDGPAKEIAEDLVGAIVDLYGEGLARIMQALPVDTGAGEAIRQRLASDGVVASLLLIHDLYPVPLETRVLEALASVRPYMESHGGNVELAGIVDGVAQLRLEGHCHGCPASLSTLELAIKDALEQAAPDLLGVEVDGLVQPETPGKRPSPRWLSLDSADDVEPGALRTVTARGVELLVANVAGTLLAYRSECPCCESGLADAELEDEFLTCGRCKHRFDLVQAGRAVGSDDVYLEPVPLLRTKGLEVTVALAT
jgi:Fe-S cluster biogenesis protein NfuA/nitrite reductase/ring-hydroxylating ferredoxin subunit